MGRRRPQQRHSRPRKQYTRHTQHNAAQRRASHSPPDGHSGRQKAVFLWFHRVDSVRRQSYIPSLITAAQHGGGERERREISWAKAISSCWCHRVWVQVIHERNGSSRCTQRGEEGRGGNKMKKGMRAEKRARAPPRQREARRTPRPVLSIFAKALAS